LSEHTTDPILEGLEEINDVELLLLSWTQMMAVEMIMADEEALAAKADLAAILITNYGITDLNVKQRTYEYYDVAYRENGTEKVIRFATDEVESIYDL